MSNSNNHHAAPSSGRQYTNDMTHHRANASSNHIPREPPSTSSADDGNSNRASAAADAIASCSFSVDDIPSGGATRRDSTLLIDLGPNSDVTGRNVSDNGARIMNFSAALKGTDGAVSTDAHVVRERVDDTTGGQHREDDAMMKEHFPSLADNLGSGWPSAAGSWGDVLNNATSSVEDRDLARTSTLGRGRGSVGNARNKSVNPLSHVGKTFKDNSTPPPTYQEAASFESSNRRANREPHTIYDNVPTSITNMHNRTLRGQTYNNNGGAVNNFVEPTTPAAEELYTIPGTRMERGSLVTVSTDVTQPLDGVVCWIGLPAGSAEALVGVELDTVPHDTPLDATNGWWRGRRLFKCDSNRCVFVRPDQCRPDPRFEMDETAAVGGDFEIGTFDMAACSASLAGGALGGLDGVQQFGDKDCPVVEGVHPPMSIMQFDQLKDVCGMFKGIQGHHNSCYLDATLFGMFAFSRVFDAVLYRTAVESDIAAYAAIQTVLRDEIVNPLRTSHFVRADRVLRLRKMLEEVCSVKGLTTEEKDPEEFLNILLAETLKAQPFLQLNSGQEAFCYQLFVDKDDQLTFPTVQQLFDQSLLCGDIKLRTVPSCLIVQMPRFGKEYKMYSRILPSLVLDVTDVIANSPRQCSICGNVAYYECKDCFTDKSVNSIETATFCRDCFMVTKQHNNADRTHRPRILELPAEFRPDQHRVTRSYMELFAVVCIETSHYVSFVKTGEGEAAPWCFFDSMADRRGGQAGYNIPELVPVPEVADWLSDAGSLRLHESAPGDRQLPKLAKRLLCDAYLCMYQSKDMLMYQ